MPYLLGLAARMRTFGEISASGAASGVKFQVASSSATCSFQLHNSWLTRCCCCISSLQLLFVSLVKKLACVWRNMLHSPSSYLLLAILQLLQYSCRADAGTINIPPTNVTVNLNETAMFWCNATGFNTKWSINGMTYRPNNRTEDNYQFAENIIGAVEDQRLIHMMYLTFTATVPRNNTAIICIAFTNNVRLSAPAFLTVRGAPAAPDVSLTAVSSSEMILQWPVPFTWPDLNITRYDITTNNSINGQTSWSSQSNSLTVPADPNSPLCTLYRYSVVAHNRLGASGPGTVTGGFPRVPIVAPNSNDISADVRFHPDLTPVLLIKVTLPRVCPYQMVQYVVTLMETKTSMMTEVMTDTVLYNTLPMIAVTVDDGIQRDHTYQITVSMTLVGIEQDQQPSPISRLVSTALVNQHNTVHTPSVSEPVVGSLATPSSSVLSLDLLVLFCSVGGAVLVSIIILSVIILMFWHHRRRSRSFRTSGSKSPTTPPMVANPIYEGQPLYETIDPHFRLPMPLPSGPASFGTCSSPTENPYKNDIGPYSNCPQIMGFAPRLDEGYTIMSSVRDESKATESHSSGSEPDSADMARYVPDPSMQYASEC